MEAELESAESMIVMTSQWMLSKASSKQAFKNPSLQCLQEFQQCSEKWGEFACSDYSIVCMAEQVAPAAGK